MKRSVPAGLVLFVVAVSAVAMVGLSYQYWGELKGDDSAGAAVRNIGLVGGGLIAMMLALWRSTIAQRQVEVAEQDSLDGQFQKAAGMLGHEDLFVRLGGVLALYYLGSNHLDRYGYQVCAILDNYSTLRHPARDESDQQTHIERVGPRGIGTHKYSGPVDGGAAFNAFWDLQEKLHQLHRDRNRVRGILSRRFRRALADIRRLRARVARRP